MGMVWLETACPPPDSSTHICLQVSRTGDTLPLKTGTAVRDDDAGRSVGMVCLNIESFDVRFLDLSQKMHGLVGMACAQG
jgi:predicted transcriptional regulator YheO